MTAPTLTEFLLARIAEDEAAAKACVPPEGHWIADGRAGLGSLVDGGGWDIFNCGDEHPGHADRDFASHIARHDPARVLAECEAKRRIVESCTMSLAATDEAILGWEAQGDTVLRHLAAVHSDHPDYDEPWRA